MYFFRLIKDKIYVYGILNLRLNRNEIYKILV